MVAKANKVGPRITLDKQLSSVAYTPHDDPRKNGLAKLVQIALKLFK
jgi:hypothetical protein